MDRCYTFSKDEFSISSTHDSKFGRLEELKFLWLYKPRKVALEPGAKFCWVVFNLKKSST